MKKLMLAVAVAFVAVASQAAQIKWSARNIYIPVAADVSVSQSGIVMSSGTGFAAGALTVSLYWVGNDSTQHYINDFSTTASGAIGAQVLGDSSTDTALYNAMLAEGSSYKPAYFFTATYVDEYGTYTYNGTVAATTAIGNLPSSNIAAAGNFATGGSWDYVAKTAPVIPEPTSGLLVLLGIAGLAIRRKRA